MKLKNVTLFQLKNKEFMNTIVGNKIRSLRKQKGMSQEQVADYLHVSQSTYARMETGESASWSSYIQPLCAVFEIQPEELLKQDSIVINQNQQGGNSNNAYVINQLSEKLIEQYELRLQEKDELITLLRKQNN